MKTKIIPEPRLKNKIIPEPRFIRPNFDKMSEEELENYQEGLEEKIRNTTLILDELQRQYKALTGKRLWVF